MIEYQTRQTDCMQDERNAGEKFGIYLPLGTIWSFFFHRKIMEWIVFLQLVFNALFEKGIKAKIETSESR